MMVSSIVLKSGLFSSNTPWRLVGQTPLGSRPPPWEQTKPPGADTPREQTPHSRWLLLWTVHIILECILVFIDFYCLSFISFSFRDKIHNNSTHKKYSSLDAVINSHSHLVKPPPKVKPFVLQSANNFSCDIQFPVQIWQNSLSIEFDIQLIYFVLTKELFNQHHS